VGTGVPFPGLKRGADHSPHLVPRLRMSRSYTSIIKAMMIEVLRTCFNYWSVTLREEHRLRVFENRVLRRIFGPKRDEVTGEWRKLHNEELNILYSSPDIIRQFKSRRMRWAGHVARMEEERNLYRVLMRKPEGKKPLGKTKA
jgi:hypothetical protein